MADTQRKIPAHVAIIMDGNGRWAKKRGLPRTMGHAQGAKVVEQILEDADHMGIRYLTVYAFSTENWTRPGTEVKALMNLLRTYMKTSLAKCAKNNVRIRVIGDKTRLDPDLQDSIRTLEEATKNNTGIGLRSRRKRLRENCGRRILRKRQFRMRWIPREFRTRICSSAPAVRSGFRTF